MTTRSSYDFIIIGAGIVGLTTALELHRRHSASKIAIIEKESTLGVHASGRNSGVLHAGIYYGSDTLKARACSLGSKAMQEYATERGIGLNRCGKVIVATRPETASQIDVLEERAKKNGIRVERLNEKGLKKIEPHARSFGDALYSPDTAIIDSAGVLNALKLDLTASGIELLLNTVATEIDTSTKTITTSGGTLQYGHLVNSSGAHADKIAHRMGVGLEFALIPFRGSYYKLAEQKNSWVRGNIYPAPDLRYPFLGVHLTRSIDGSVYLGPTATPALGREETSGILSGRPTGETINIFGRIIRMYIRNEEHFRALVHAELARYSKGRFLEELQAMVPGLELDDLVKSEKSGIRPQLINTNTLRLEMDFIIRAGADSTHILNAISPAFTASFEFAKLVADAVEGNIKDG